MSDREDFEKWLLANDGFHIGPFEAWQGACASLRQRVAELKTAWENATHEICQLTDELAALKSSQQPEEAKCKSCGANDFEMPCAYPGKWKHGCLRDARLTSAPKPEEG